jgi:EAL domain-containing protein (putative c-di-GMP-specific phosphodiesterase class I)
VLGAAERLGRLHDVGRRVRTLAATAFASIGNSDALLFVNLHSEDLLDEELASRSTPLGAVASRVVLEITERASLDHVPNVRERVSALRDVGFRIAVDDLGAGYAGLSSFATLEPEFVKLDMSLVRDVDSSPVRQRLVESMVALSSELGSRIVAEGIERVAERDTLERLGCELLQGYLFAKPGPPFPMARW